LLFRIAQMHSLATPATTDRRHFYIYLLYTKKSSLPKYPKLHRSSKVNTPGAMNLRGRNMRKVGRYCRQGEVDNLASVDATSQQVEGTRLYGPVRFLAITGREHNPRTPIKVLEFCSLFEQTPGLLYLAQSTRTSQLFHRRFQ
jgi:hypothetical protein